MSSHQEFYDDFVKKFHMPPFFISNDALANAYFTYERIQGIADWLLARTTSRPKIAIVCGSGLGSLADHITNSTSIPYETIPDFPQSTVTGHRGNLVFGELNGVSVVAMQGRFHPYEGYTTAVCTLPVRVFKQMGVQVLILTNAAGGINLTFKVGDLMVLKDHLSYPAFSLHHPLVGPNDERFGPRFLPVNKIYTKQLRDLFHRVSQDAGIETKEGVYAVIGGPTYETVTDTVFLEKCGADAVGMSTAHEAIVASHCDMKVFAMSIVTDMPTRQYDCEIEPDHHEICEVARKRTDDVVRLVKDFVKSINEHGGLLLNGN